MSHGVNKANTFDEIFKERERSISEARRRLRGIIFHTDLMDRWSTYFPLVQRIFNADYIYGFPQLKQFSVMRFN